MSERRDTSSAATVAGDPGDESANYYVIVPFLTIETAERGMQEVGSFFDCYIVSAAAVDQDAPLLGSA